MDLEDWIARIRSRDAITYEDAYHGERPAEPGLLARLVAEMHAAPDGFTRGKFAELLGEMGNASVVPHLIAELSHPEPDTQLWAALALETLGDPVGVRAAQAYRAAHPEAFALSDKILGTQQSSSGFKR